MNEELMYHIALRKGDAGEYVILTGDPGRCGDIAAYLDGAVKMAQNREFVTYTGYLGEKKVSVTSTGIGGPSAAIAMEELAKIGAHTFIRVGTAGGISLKVKSGDLAIASAAVRDEGTSREYAPLEYPAAADFNITCALAESARELGFSYHTGVVQSKDSFYGQHSPERMPVSEKLLSNWEALKRLNVLASEMECAALFTVAASLNVRCGAVLNILWNQERKKAGMAEKDNYAVERGIKTAVAAIRKDYL